MDFFCRTIADFMLESQDLTSIWFVGMGLYNELRHPSFCAKCEMNSRFITICELLGPARQWFNYVDHIRQISPAEAALVWCKVFIN